MANEIATLDHRPDLECPLCSGNNIFVVKEKIIIRERPRAYCVSCVQYLAPNANDIDGPLVAAPNDEWDLRWIRKVRQQQGLPPI